MVKHKSPILVKDRVYTDLKTFDMYKNNNQNESLDSFRGIFFKDHDDTKIRVCTNLMNISAEVISEIYKAIDYKKKLFNVIKLDEYEFKDVNEDISDIQKEKPKKNLNTVSQLLD